MSLIDLINNLSLTEQSKLLGSNTTKILRYTFTTSETEAISKDILSSAIAAFLGEELIMKEAFRGMLIESIPKSKLKFKSYDNAKSYYKTNLGKFINDFNIETKYLPIKVVENRKSFEYAIPVFGECNGTNAFPHFYQLSMKTRIVNDLKNNYNNSILVTMPTGAGKTVLAMEIIVDLFRSRVNDKSLHIGWFVDSKELSEQSLQSFQKIWKQKGDRKVLACRYFGDFDKLENRAEDKITFGGFPLISARIQDEELLTYLSSIDVLFLDEAHGVKAEIRSDVINLYRTHNKESQIIGLTATPFRQDDSEYSTLKGSFHSYFELLDEGNKEVESPINFLIERQFLSRVSFQVLHSEDTTDKAEYYNSLHNSVIQECNNLVSENKNVIIFAESKSHAIALSIFLSRNNINNGLIVGETADAKRKNMLEQFGDQKNKLNVIVNHQILSTGIDVPGMNAIMVLGEIGSPTLAMQILGRAMRGPKNGGNKSNIIYLTNNNYKHLERFDFLEQVVLNR